MQYLIQGFETCKTVYICIEHVHKGNRSLVKVIIADSIPLNDILILTISLCSTVRVFASPPTVFDAEIRYLQHSLDTH